MLYGDPSDPPGHPSLFGINLGIREEIFHLVLVSEDKVKICMSCETGCNHGYGTASTVNTPPVPGLLAVCRQAYQEGCRMYYTENKFTVEGCETLTDEVAISWLQGLTHSERILISYVETDEDVNNIVSKDVARTHLEDFYESLQAATVRLLKRRVFITYKDH
jgi:hypothetical protein